MRPDPTILAFDTSAAHCAAALLCAGQITVVVEDMARGQGERLLPLLQEVLASQKLAWADLDAIAVGTGPGNFTGLRIGVSAARGLALGLGVPAIGISLFDTTQALAGRTQTAVPAPRDQYYIFESDTQRKPTLTDHLPDSAYALSSDHSAADHVACMVRLAAVRAPHNTPRPAPLYVRPADAAPPRHAAPVILP